MSKLQYRCHFSIQATVWENPIDVCYQTAVEVLSLALESNAQLCLKHV